MINKFDLGSKDFGLDLISSHIESLVRILPELIYVLDLEQSKLVYVNTRITDILGYDFDDIQQMEYSFAPIMIHADMVSFSDDISQRFMGLKFGEKIEFTLEFRHKNKQIRTLKNTGTLLKQNPKEENRYIMFIAEDITEVKANLTDVENYRNELERQVSALNKSNKELEQFAYIASHDLQEPLRKIKAFGERLVNKYHDILGDEGKFFVDRMTNAAQRMNILIEDLLKYSRASRQVEPLQKIALKEVVKNVLDDLEIKIINEKAKIELGDLPTIEVQAVQMRQLFQNLIENALKFRQAAQDPIIKINAIKIDRKTLADLPQLNQNLDYFQISINDNGIGFDQKYAEQIFTIFQRLHGRSEFEGTGLGLAICKKIVESHQGLIEAFSQEGVGTTFTFYLPINKNIKKYEE